MQKDTLTVKTYTTCKEMAVAAATDVAKRMNELLSRKPSINMIFASAPSQLDFFAALIARSDIEWSRIHAFHMDEYIGLPKEAPQTFGNFLKKHLFNQVSFAQVFYMEGTGPVEHECERYTSLLADYPPDIVCLGIGENGHIAFNDPHVADFNDPLYIKVVELDEISRRQQVNDNCFRKLEEVPRQALTLTIPALMLAPYMYCTVPFQAKAKAVYQTINGDISEDCPASILRTKENAILYLDQDSSALLMNHLK